MFPSRVYPVHLVACTCRPCMVRVAHVSVSASRQLRFTLLIPAALGVLPRGSANFHLVALQQFSFPACAGKG